jgi:hypothetical protein
MTTKTKLGATAGLLAAALLAACSGGGSSGASHPVAIASPASGAGTTPQSTGARLTFTINRSKTPHQSSASASRRRSSSAKRSPAYFSYSSVQGLQLTVTSGSASKTLYVDISTSAVSCGTDPTTQIETCSIVVPTLGPTETISALEVDRQPSNETQSTGLGTAFPSNSYLLAISSPTTVTLTPGMVSDVPISLNPVAGQLYDDGVSTPFFSSNLAVDDVPYEHGLSAGPRLVVTPNVASSTGANPGPSDMDGYNIPSGPCLVSGGAYTCSGQPLVDVNASPVPTIATVNSSAFTLYFAPIDEIDNNGASPLPLPAPSTLTQTASIADTSLLWDSGAYLDINYSGAAIAAGTTITMANQLTATPPVFTGAPSGSHSPQPATYAASLTYTVVPLTVSPTSSQASPIYLNDYPSYSTTATVTGSDLGSYSGLAASAVPANSSVYPSQTSGCYDSNGDEVLTISPGAYNPMTGTQTFTVGEGPTGGNCSFVLYDLDSGVVTNTIYVRYVGG